jgi:hypothetical protein
MSGDMFWLLAISLGVLGFYLGTKAQRAEHTPFEFGPEVRRLEIHLPAGRIRLRGVPGPGLKGVRTFRYLFRRPVVYERVEGDLLRIDGEVQALKDRGGFADYTLDVPADLHIRARTSAGTIEAQGLTGTVQLQAAAGSIRIEDLGGSISLRTSAGGVVGRGLSARRAEAYGSAGSIDLAFITTPEYVRVENHAGSIALTLPGGPFDVQATTDVGSARVSVPVEAGASARIEVRTSLGSIDVRPTVAATPALATPAPASTPGPASS